MSAGQAGFSLLEGLLALALGLMLLVAASQVFVASVQAWRLQSAVAQQQEDARLALQRIAQDIRMTGVFGCLRLHASDFEQPSAAAAFAKPLQISQGGAQLNLLVGQLPGSGSRAEWTILTDCRSWAEVKSDAHDGDDQTLALPVSRITYELRNGSLRVVRRGSPQALIDNVRSLRASLVSTAHGHRVDVQLVLFDPQFDIEQQHVISVALRNRLPGP